MNTRCLIVVPTYNESANIRELLERVRVHVPDADVLVVDDDSPDGTAGLAAALGEDLGHITVLRRTGPRGLGAAYRAGFAWAIRAGYSIVVEMDADLSHDPRTVPHLVRSLEYGADLTIGSRYVRGGDTEGWSAWRRLLSRAGNLYARGLLGLAVTDATSGFRAYRTGVLSAIDFETSQASGYGFQIELTARVARYGGRIVEIPIVFHDRTRGRSKMSARIAFEALVLVSRWAVRDRILRRRATVRPAAEAVAPPGERQAA